MPSYPRSTHHHHHLTKDGAIPEVKYNHDELFENAIIGIMALDLFSAVKGSLFHGDAINIDNLVRFQGEMIPQRKLGHYFWILALVENIKIFSKKCCRLKV